VGPHRDPIVDRAGWHGFPRASLDLPGRMIEHGP
jgi:hypothetical protein